jgi:putative transposase
MRTTFFKLWVHSIVHVAENSVLIDPLLEPLLYLEIEKRLIEQGCEVAAIRGQADHVHFLFNQNPLLSLHETIRFVQGISQRWYHINDRLSGAYKFRWEDGYMAYSVSESNFKKTQQFIDNQKDIHLKINYYEEQLQLNYYHKVDIQDDKSDLEIKSLDSFNLEYIEKQYF